MHREISLVCLVVMIAALVLVGCATETTPTSPEPTSVPEETQPVPEDEQPTPEDVEPAPEDEEPAPDGPADEAQLISIGEGVFATQCSPCHQAEGQGVEGTYPALDGNSLVTSDDPTPVILTVLTGRGAMPSFQDALSDEEIAGVVSYIRTSWSNDASTVSVEDVEAAQ